MNIKQIKALAEILEGSSLTMLEVCEGETRIRLEKKAPAVQTVQAVQPMAMAAPGAPASTLPDVEASAVDFNHITEVKSPMVGVFYTAPSPDAEPYVRRGSRVKKGDVLCIIEAMKLLNEIVAEVDGEIADICVQNGEVVEFSQTLFKIY